MVEKRKKNVSYNSIRDIHEDWSLDDRNGYPYSGESVQTFIKDTLNNKGGEFYFDADTTKYLIFANAENRDLYLSDREQYADLVIGTFDAPANYTAEINMATPASNVVLSGSKGCYIDFTFDVKSRSGSSTGEDVIATFTFNNAGNIKKVTQIYNAGTDVHFLADAYLEDGSNTVSVVVTGRNTLVSAMAAVNFTLVALQLTSDFDFSVAVPQGEFLAIPYRLEGAGVKYIDWYVDGTKLADVDTIPDLRVNRVKNIDTSEIEVGKHNVLCRAYITNNGQNFYSITLYFDFVISPESGTWSSNTTYVLLGLNLNSPVTETVSVSATQYLDFLYKAAIFDSRSRSLQMAVVDNGTQMQTITMYPEDVESLSYTPTTAGSHTITFTADGSSASIDMNVSTGDVDIEEITDGLLLKLSAKGRSNSETNPNTWDYENIHTTFSNGFAWNEQSGWSNDALVIPAGESITIGILPLSGNVVSTGKTIEIDYETTNIVDDNATVLNLTNGSTGAGLNITASTARLTSSGGETVNTKYRDGDRVHLAFIINRTSGDDSRMMYIVNNGILERAERFATSDNFTATGNIVIGSTGCTVKVHGIRVYDHALTVDEAFCNYAIDSDDLINIASQNDIFDPVTGAISADKVNARIPIMIITGDISYILNISDKSLKNAWNTYPVQIEYRNMQNPEMNFFLDNADIRLLGTTSITYPRKNFRIYSISESGKYNTKLYSPTHTPADLVLSGKYAFKEGSAPVSCWCLKADYAESSGSHNTGVARLWNQVMYNATTNGEHPLRTMAQTWADEHNYPYDVRTTIDGFPIVLFLRDNENAPLTCFGQYNFNNDKSTEDVFGFTALTVDDGEGHTQSFDNSNVECWEVLDSDNQIALFTNVSNFDSGWADAFEARYPDKNTNTAALKRVAQFVNSCYQGMSGGTMQVNLTNWRAGKADYFDLPKLAAYYVYLLRMGAVDQTVKNAMFTTEDGQHWFYINYDNDTILGIDNESHQFDTWDYDLKSRTQQGGWYYAGKGLSVLWNCFEADSECMTLARQIDQVLFSAGFTYEAICNMFDNEQSSKWCERIYNENGRYKYIEQALLGLDRLYMLQGSRKSHRHWFLQHRLEKYDNVFGNGTYSQRSIQARATGTVNIPQGATYKFTPAITSYFGYGVASTIVDAPTERTAGVEYTSTGLPQATGVGNFIYIYNANNIEALDVSGYINALGTLNISAAVDLNGRSRLRRLKLGDGENTNVFLESIAGLIIHLGLEELDIRGYEAITSMDFDRLPNLHVLNAVNSGLTSFSPAEGAALTNVQLPSTIQSINLSGTNVTSLGLTASKTITSVSLRNVSGTWESNGGAKTFINTWLALFTDSELELISMTLSGINWTGMTAAQVLKFGKVGTHTLRGKVTLSSMNKSEYDQIVETFGADVFDPNGTFVIDAPAGILISGPATVSEGENGTYIATVFPVGQQTVHFALWDGAGNRIQESSGGIAEYYTISLNCNTGVLTVGALGSDLTIGISAYTNTLTSSILEVTAKDVQTIGGIGSYTGNYTSVGSYPILLNPTNPNYTVPVTSMTVEYDDTGELQVSVVSALDLQLQATVTSIPNASKTWNVTVRATDALNNNYSVICQIGILAVNISSFEISGVTPILASGNYPYQITNIYPLNYNKNISRLVVVASTGSSTLPVTLNGTSGFTLSVPLMPDETTTVTITATATLESGVDVVSTKEVVLKVVNKPIDLGLPSGLLWSNMNLGAESAEEAGLYYSWGNTDGHTPGDGYMFNPNLYDQTSGSAINTNLQLANDAANVALGGEWRMPTKEEVLELFDSNYTTKTHSASNGVLGWRITSKINNRSIFIPKVGHIAYGGSPGTTEARYWTASIGGSSGYAYQINGDGSNITYSVTNRYQGLTIRPVMFPPSLNGNSKITEMGTYNYTIDHLSNVSSITASVSTPTSGTVSMTTSGTTAVLNVTSMPSSAENVTITVVATTTGGSTTTITKNVLIKMATVIMTSLSNPEVLAICYQQGWCADSTKMTDIEAEDVTNIGAVFNSTNITHFEELAHFTNITTLNASCFWNCNGLASITIPDSVTSIGLLAFYNCRSLSSIIIPNTVTSIGLLAFYGCIALASITLSSNITSIAQALFDTCSALTSVIIPNNVTSIGLQAFRNCSALSSITIPNSVTEIGSSVFSQCTALTSITIPNGIGYINEYTFNGCSALTSVTIPNSVTIIYNYAFNNCTSLESITIPNGVLSIGNRTFNGCNSLASITIPASVTSIGTEVFAGCTSLTSIEVAAGNTTYDSRNNCNAIIQTGQNVLVAGCRNTTIPNTVTSIGLFAFSQHKTLESITIPASVTSIGIYAFWYCTALTSITIPNSVTEIGSNTFDSCYNLVSVILPSNITSIASSLFSNCSGLASITIPDSVTSIGTLAFGNCNKLATVTCLSTVAPTIVNLTFSNTGSLVPAADRVLNVPTGATGYDSGLWKSQLIDRFYTLNATL